MESNAHIPEGWYEAAFGSLIKEQPKSTIKVSNATRIGDYPFFTSGEAILRHDRSLTEGESLFLSTGGTAHVAYFNGKAAYSTDTYTVKSIHNTSALFLYYYLIEHLPLIDAQMFDGSGLKHLQKKDFKRFVVTLPKSRKEQERIAHILQTIDNVISTTQSLIDKYTNIREGMMDDLLTNGIDSTGHVRTSRIHQYKASPLGPIPEEWEIVPFSKLIMAIDPHPSHRTPPGYEGGVPFLGIGDLTDGRINFSSCRKVPWSVWETQQKNFSIEEFDYIFGKIGTIGRPTLLPAIDDIKYTLNANVMLVKPYDRNNFSYWTANSKYISNQIELLTNSTSQPAFGIQKIRSLLVKCPMPDERQRIADILDRCSSVILHHKNNLNKYNDLHRALLHDLITGKKITVQL